IFVASQRVVPGLIPVADLKPHKDAKDNDHEVQEDRDPILLFQMSGDPAKPHYCPSTLPHARNDSESQSGAGGRTYQRSGRGPLRRQLRSMIEGVSNGSKAVMTAMGRKRSL